MDSTFIFEVRSATAAAERSAAKPLNTLRNEVTLLAPTELASTDDVAKDAEGFRRMM